MTVVGATSPRKTELGAPPLFEAVRIIHSVCCITGSFNLLDDIREDVRRQKIDIAVQRHDTPTLFNWLVSAFSFQGISDRVAAGYLRKHGTATWDDIDKNLRKLPTCPRLKSYWTYDQCGYDKGSGCCSEPEHVQACPVPTHRLRNGRLNQTAYSLFLFVRDIADGDIVGWMDRQIVGVSSPAGNPRYVLDAQEALIGPLRHVFGVSDKLLTMTLASLLIGAQRSRPEWLPIGASMIAIDTLVHNFLHRTGILRGLNADHPYGARCYGEGGCADIVRAASGEIDASRFNKLFPINFPRFVQHAIWQYCALNGLNICNGNTINDRLACTNNHCAIYSICGRISILK